MGILRMISPTKKIRALHFARFRIADRFANFFFVLFRLLAIALSVEFVTGKFKWHDR